MSDCKASPQALLLFKVFWRAWYTEVLVTEYEFNWRGQGSD